MICPLGSGNESLSIVLAVVLVGVGVCVGCESQGRSLSGDPDNGGLLLPNGFEAIVVADSIGPARHLAVRDNGDIYAKLKQSNGDGSIVALRDTTEDGRANVTRTFGAFSESEGSFQKIGRASCRERVLRLV